MPELSGLVMRVESHMLPGLIAAYEEAVEGTTDVVLTIARRGRVPEPWTHDPHTENLTWTFNQWAVDAPDSAYQMLVKYQQELMNVLDSLKQIQAEYERTETGVADDMSRL